VGIDTLRKCNTCGLEAHIEEDLELFERDDSGLHGRRNRCKACKRALDTKYRRENPKLMELKSKRYHAENVYGITLEEYLERMSTSDCCEICGIKEKLGYDHCHDTMKFRGILCNKCNRSIGMLGDTLESIMKVVRYLSKKENV
jgi:hypothetical protein